MFQFLLHSKSPTIQLGSILKLNKRILTFLLPRTYPSKYTIQLKDTSILDFFLT